MLAAPRTSAPRRSTLLRSRSDSAARILTATRAFEKQQDFLEKEKEYIRRNIAGVNSRQAKGRRTKLAEKRRALQQDADDGSRG